MNLKSSLMMLGLCLSLAGLLRAANPQESGKNTDKRADRYLVEMNCAPDNRDAVTGTLLMALALRADQSEVTLFIDLDAVLLADPASNAELPELRDELTRLFAKANAAGVRVLVCPHCAGLKHVTAESLRHGLRFTNKEEFEAVRNGADQVYEYRPKQEAGVKDSGANDNRET